MLQVRFRIEALASRNAYPKGTPALADNAFFDWLQLTSASKIPVKKEIRGNLSRRRLTSDAKQLGRVSNS